ncbi:hypothetical protein DERF_006409 [Dermatophagoides farinae]|uniref:Uncharacterized protein n=1 Tax=Dermatophagoides farinae TaxID=6954 RepID=A0A922I7Q4_DERFA|nr:hypothetical protein DERF_006409 [Dermatophagoides farinae]
MQIFQRFLSSFLPLIFYTFYCWLLFGVDHRTMMPMIEMIPMIDQSPSSSSSSSPPELRYENLFYSCQSKGILKRMGQFGNSGGGASGGAGGGAGGGSTLCNRTRLSEELQTYIQYSICLVYNQLPDADKSKRNSGHIRKPPPSSPTTTGTFQVTDDLIEKDFPYHNENRNRNRNNYPRNGGYNDDANRLLDYEQQQQQQNGDHDESIRILWKRYHHNNNQLDQHHHHHHHHHQNQNQKEKRNENNNGNKNPIESIYRQIFEKMTQHLNRLSSMQENYAIGNDTMNGGGPQQQQQQQQHHQQQLYNHLHESERKQRKLKQLNKLERLEQVLHHLKEDIIKKLIYIARCANFEHECQQLKTHTTNNGLTDTAVLSRFHQRYRSVLRNYIEDLKNSLSLIYHAKGSDDNADEITNRC